MASHKIGDRIRAWGYDFTWTAEHMSPEQLHPLKYSYDVLAADCLDRFDELVPSLPLRSRSKPKTGSSSTEPAVQPGTESPETTSCPHPDFYDLLQKHAPHDKTLRRLLDEVNTVPPWVDWAQIERGQKVFYRYAGPSIVSLTFHSLLGGMGARRVVETLTRTGGFGIKVARRRLLETFQHVLDVSESLDAIKPGGRGFASTLRVRFLHASVQRRILRLAARDPSYYDVSSLGIPISDLDAVSTALAFSASTIWVGFPRQGIHLRPSEVADYLALWRYVAYLLGTPDSFLSSPSLAKAAMESIVLAEVDPTTTSQILANNIITALADKPPTYASADFLRAEARWLNGSDLADRLAVPRPPVYYTLLVAGQCLFFMVLCYVRRAVTSWDERGIARLRRILRDVTLDQMGGKEAMHAFRYLPELGKLTTSVEEKDTDDKTFSGPFSRQGVERRNLVSVLVGLVGVGLATWLCGRLVTAVV
ncbi:tat pathway signal sequence [Echria macrotheca]|uniref:Tat pathway signal sequence n=1 Tax=Echria macrotheca TaxID=438768 RepID=A0AAJ0F8Q5_9PEZI|nr:tat pathway signal sequence [Echria macrotheca]